MIRTHILTVILLVFTGLAAQPSPVRAIIDNQIAYVNTTAPAFTLNHTTSTSLTNIYGLTYDSLTNAYYSIKNRTSNPRLVKIDTTGTVTDLGFFTYNGNQIPLVEGISVHRNSGRLIISASLNGGVSNNDYSCESILEVDKITGVCTLIYALSYPNISNADADAITFDGDDLYLLDGVPSTTTNYIYKANFNTSPGTLTATSFLTSSYKPFPDLTCHNGYLYLLQERNLYSVNLSNPAMNLVGATHGTGQYNGNMASGITYLTSCNAPVFTTTMAVDSCSGEATLSVSCNGCTTRWPDGSIGSLYTTSSSGNYIATIKNSCDSVTHSFTVNIPSTPSAPVPVITYDTCDGTALISYNCTDCQITWPDGSKFHTYEVNTSGAVEVFIESDCGQFTRSINIALPTAELEYTISTTPVQCGLKEEVRINCNFCSVTWSDGSSGKSLIPSKSEYITARIQGSCGVAEEKFWVNAADIKSTNTIPNVFTPNGDGVNDYLKFSDSFIGADLMVGNRWGTIVYKSGSYDNTWDGADLASGVYYYIIKHPCTGDEFTSLLHIQK